MFRVTHRKVCILSLFFFILVSLFMSGPIAAAEGPQTSTGEAVEETGHESGAEAGHGSDRSGDLLDLLWRFINFALLVIILFIVIKKSPLKGFFAARGEEIRQKLEDLKKEKEEAENRYLEMEKQLKEFEAKRNDIIDRYKKEGLVEKDKIIEEAKERVKQILEQSELTIQQEMESAKQRLKGEIVELAAKKTREILMKEMDERDHDQLIHEFIEKVGKVH
jgi:F-type H+-transporting ATPase subunit b